MEHVEVKVESEDDKEEAYEALDNLLAGAQAMISISERNSPRAPDNSTLVIPLDLEGGISLLISKDYLGKVRH